MSITNFDQLSLSPEMLKTISEMGFQKPTPIQAGAIPLLLGGKDIVGQSETGSGKTAAFAIPVVERVSPKSHATQALVLCPTRELAMQVASECTKIARYKKGIIALPVYGGQPIGLQLQALRRGVQIIIGTPGRILDHIERGSLSLNSVTMAVLDEADEMLDMGFREDITKILDSIGGKRQMAFFSATIPGDIKNLIAMYMNNPEMIKTGSRTLTVATTRQFYCDVEQHQKAEILCRLIDINDVQRGIVFCNQKWMVDELVKQLKVHGYSADAIHGDLNQPARDRVMNAFRKGAIKLLVATDVAARGIDVEDIDAVFNYDLPLDEEDYVHRIGRTGRAGKTGTAFTLVTGRSVYKLKSIERFAGVRIQRMPVPTYEDARRHNEVKMTAGIRAVISEGHLTYFTNLVSQICSKDITPTDVAAALLKMHSPKPKATISIQSHGKPEARHEKKNNSREREPFHGKKKFFSKNRNDRPEARHQFRNDGFRRNDRG
jgi:ATP-dependent RNA helicase DeaD